MSDLIDWKSPEIKVTHGPKLASPLIPVPTETENANLNTCNDGLSSLNNGKRTSLDNNPFDVVFKETTEYVRKKDDPFESVLEKALKSKPKRNITSRTLSIDSPKDCTPRRKRRADILKLNKTLDDSLFNKELAVLNLKKGIPFNGVNESIIQDLNNTNLLSEDAKQNHQNDEYPQCNYIMQVNSSLNLSILNQSAMNDTFSEGSHVSEDCGSKPATQNNKSLCTMKETIDDQNYLSVNDYLRLPKLRRSLSQGEKFSPKKHTNWTSQSIIESSKPRQQSNSDRTIDSLPSVFFDDSINKAFLDSKLTNSSVFSSMSDISAIRKLSSASTAGYNTTGSVLSSGTMNRAFINSYSTSKSNSLYENQSEKGAILRRSFSVSSAPSTVSTKDRIEMSDLEAKLNRLKFKSIKMDDLRNVSSNIDKTVITGSDSKIERLIDVDIFVPDTVSNKEQHTSSISESSLDSVFSVGSKNDKSILQEAILLAKTFEELATKSEKDSASSSTDDLLSNNPLWMSELLPAFEDEDLTGNLIELPSSPNINDNNAKSTTGNTDSTNASPENIQVAQDDIKSIESELIDPIPLDKKTAAATLLLDLEKLIQAENNSEAIKLLEQLEKVLGIDCRSNSELLVTCLNNVCELVNSPQKSESKLNGSKNAERSDVETNMKDNTDNNSTKEVTKQEITTADIINANTDKLLIKQENTTADIINAVTDESSGSIQESLELAEKKVENSQENPNNLEITHSPIDNNENRNRRNDSETIESSSSNKEENTNESNNSTHKQINESRSDEKLAIELLVNLGKILNKESVESAPLNVLKNLGKVLNFAINNSNFENTQNARVNNKSTKQSPIKGKSNYQRRGSYSGLPKSSYRQSLDLSKTKQPEKSSRRSIPVNRTTPNKPISNSLISSKDKSKSHLKESKKRFSSDPGCINTLENNKKINSMTETKTDEPQKDIPLKSISLLNVNKEKSSVMIDNVKNKLKKKVDSNVAIKKGPMKAFIPLGSMQKIELTEGKVSSSTDITTPPKSRQSIPRFTVTSSTPNSVHNQSINKRSPRTKPMASSTPDSTASKSHTMKTRTSQESKKGNVSCEISPVSTQTDANDSDPLKGSPKRITKSPSLRKRTPVKYQRPDTVEFNRPKYFTSPRLTKKNNSQVEVNQLQQNSEPNQVVSRKTHDSKSGSPLRKGRTVPQQSPLKDSNKLPMKNVRPFKLISKLQYSGGNNVMEKENHYA